MKKIHFVIAGLGLIGLFAGCENGAIPTEVRYEGSSDTARSEGSDVVVPQEEGTRSEGTTDETITAAEFAGPTAGSSTTGGTTGGSDERTEEDEETSPTPARARPERETFLCRNPEPLEGYPGIVHCIEGYCKITASGKKLNCPYGVPEGMGTPTAEAPAAGDLYQRLPADVTSRFGGILFTVLPSQHDQDVQHLMNDTFQPDEFTAYETQVQSRIVAERVALGEDFGIQLKNYVVEVLRKGIDAERLHHEAFNQGVVQLGQVIAAFKSGDLLRSLNAVRDGVLSRRELFDAVSRHPDLLKQAGAYLEIQFAEAYKDIAKASFPRANEEVSAYSTLVWGGDAFDLVYKPNGFLDQGFNHIRGLSDADIWHVGANNWHAVATGLRSALNTELHPEAAASAARAIEEASRAMREQGEDIVNAMGRW